MIEYIELFNLICRGGNFAAILPSNLPAKYMERLVGDTSWRH